MFFIKRKTFLKDLIPDDYIDIHSHLLPNIDDGAKALEDTFFLTNQLKKIGFSKFITTPHIYNGIWDNTKEGILNLEKETNSSLISNGFTTQLSAAAEYLLNDHFVTLFKNREILVLKDNYVLVEISYQNPPIQLYEIIFELQVAGYKPVLAHPERYNYYHSKFDEYKKLKNAGCFFQLNLLSTVGYYGKEVMEVANKLLKNGLINFVGSDVHHKQHIDAFSKKVMLKNLSPLKEAISNNQFFK